MAVQLHPSGNMQPRAAVSSKDAKRPAGNHRFERPPKALPKSPKQKQATQQKRAATCPKAKRAAMKRAAGHCEDCGNTLKHGHIHAHHTTYKRLGREYPEDLQILCLICHERRHKHAEFLPHSVGKPSKTKKAKRRRRRLAQMQRDKAIHEQMCDR